MDKKILEEQKIGEAKILVLDGIDGCYGMQGQSGWDDLPYWETWVAEIIKIQTTGIYNWGPLQYSAKTRPVSGKGILTLLENKIISCGRNASRDEVVKKADEYVLEIALDLENRGFKVKLEFGVDLGSMDLTDTYIWKDGQPKDWVCSRINKSYRDRSGLDNLLTIN